VPERDWLLISEIFTTVQGEGPSTGQRAHFIRCGACDLECTWCDTDYTWAFSERKAAAHEKRRQYDPHEELKRHSISFLAAGIKAAHTRLVVATGGEPLLQLEQLSRLISETNDLLEEKAPRWEIETAGVHSPGELAMYPNVSFNVSPKLASSGNPHNKRFQPAVLKEFVATGKARFKFVVDCRIHKDAPYNQDIAEIEGIIRICDMSPEMVWLMPVATNEFQLEGGLQTLAPIAMQHQWNLSGRMQVTIWGTERGH